ncbi:delta-lactam-biosynthetic de-N-acetylase [Clostridium sp. P21]|uniref:Delta-lactam-biosynthetic de-N-acetylase n=1 Tax=Clostridium muellerianum TaxID=2716538 RepID=A0A7Y0HP42_9CLOT|nr:delta-lactam-biosynthetic de-N-acetylase [Clostridium muellerianum]NMM63317.1 delta-lactam-biosynthetic de-N-acetylase [Clostridium muellerianum]
MRILSTAIASILTINTLTGVNLKKSENNISSQNANMYIESIYENKRHSLLDISNFLKNNLSNSQNGLSTREYEWYFQPRKDKNPPLAPKETSSFVPKYSCYHLGDTSKKVLYLTFDEGYENGYTGPILDVLKKHKVKAAFFVVKPYINSNEDLIKRMVDEGHLVCNHSSHHPSMASITDTEKFNKEFTEVEEAFEKVTNGKKMPKYFRPPMGKYSELSLCNTKSLGYKTIFWSFAYMDWDPHKQPSHEFAKKRIMDKTHNGAIVLLHAVSKTNAEILDDVITEWKNQGYELKSLDELPK